MQQKDASYWINKLQLTKHIEGGFYKEVYKSELILHKNNLPHLFKGDRHTCTSIYFLLEAGQFSALHRIASDEIWHFYAGDPLIIYEIEKDGILIEHQLGNNPEKDEQFQCVVKAGHWFGSRLARGGRFALVGCTVSPGFDFTDFELAKKYEMLKEFPQHEELIASLTYH